MLIFEVAQGAAALSIGLGVLHALRTVRAKRLFTSMGALMVQIDPAARVRQGADGHVLAEFTLQGRACVVDVVASAGWTTRWVLRMGGPMSAIMTLLMQGAGAAQRTLATGDGRFDQMFAVNASAPGALRVLSERVRGALVKLPAVMLEPRLSVEIDGVELGWHGRPTEAALVQGHGLLSLVWEEFNMLLPLR